MQLITKGRYRVRLAETPADIRAAQRLRHLAFHPDETHSEAHPHSEALDHDRFDALCQHVLIEDRTDAQLVCCFRGLELESGAEIGSSYSAQFYDLDALTAFCGRMMEIGRFCIHPDRSDDPDILRLAWASLARHVESRSIKMMFGCSSFQGTDQAQYLDTFALLKSKHLAPPEWRPRIKAQQVFRFGARLRRMPDRRKALQAMPPLLRTYLMMGGWVSDHAVIDAEMDTLHVFTGVEISAIPAARRNLLLAV
ncbi:MAG: GNAT family N-acetyltransferase [Rhodobacterales bacterium]